METKSDLKGWRRVIGDEMEMNRYDFLVAKLTIKKTERSRRLEGTVG